MKKFNLFALLIAALLLASPVVHADSDVESALGGMNKKAENMAKRDAKKAEREAKKAQRKAEHEKKKAERKAKQEAKKAEREAKKAEKAAAAAVA
ncbi:MAG TPA: hypothetical protein PLY88_00375 [Candidatus Omnitrophota bacterium]|nr:hypothetical protein [Candidatus Omnitrophota bacterium]